MKRIPDHIMAAILNEMFAIIPISDKEMYDFGRSYERGRNGIQIDSDFTDWEQSLIDDSLKNFKGMDFSDWKLDRYYSKRDYGICQHLEKTVKIRPLNGFQEPDHFEFTATHEFRHVVQHVTGNLSHDTEKDAMVWKPDGSEYKIGMRITRQEYFELPWEKDANGFAFSCTDVRIYDQTLYDARKTAKILF